MNFNKIFVFVALILAISLGNSEAGWLRKLGKKIVWIPFKTKQNELLISIFLLGTSFASKYKTN